jgi:hypothetical protein
MELALAAFQEKLQLSHAMVVLLTAHLMDEETWHQTCLAKCQYKT